MQKWSHWSWGGMLDIACVFRARVELARAREENLWSANCFLPSEPRPPVLPRQLPDHTEMKMDKIWWEWIKIVKKWMKIDKQKKYR